jgi:hypothetical protein
MRIADLLRDERIITIEVAGGSLTVTYKPSVYTPEWEARARQIVEDKQVGKLFAEFLSRAVMSWDLLNDDGSEYEVTYEAIERIPTAVLSLVVSAISNDLSVDRDETKNFDGGSPVGASKARRRSGTR